MTSYPPPPHHRLDHLDAVRGLAAVAVVCCHFTAAYPVPRLRRALTATPLAAWADGKAAVALFFILSGLVLSVRHFRDTPVPRLGGFDYGGYLVGRVCRIGLPYWAVLLGSVAAWHVSAIHRAGGPPPNAWMAGYWQGRPTVIGVLRQANLADTDGGFVLVPQAWSLAVELVVSAMVPAAVLIAARSSWWLVGVAAVACELGSLQPYALLFAGGVVLAKHYRPIVARLEPRPAARAGLVLLGWVAYTWADLPLGRQWHAGRLDVYLPGLGAALLLIACSASPGLRRWLARGFVHHVGRTSYSLYLCHVAVLFCLAPRVMQIVNGRALPFGWLVGLAATVVVSLAAAEVVYRLVEVPSIWVGHRAAAAVAKLSNTALSAPAPPLGSP